jgi:hypothetical protein
MPIRIYQPKCGATALGGKCTPEDIARAEAALRVPLPVDYRLFLQEWNGVEFHAEEFNCPTAAYVAQPLESHLSQAASWQVERQTLQHRLGEVSVLYGVTADVGDFHLVGAGDGYAFDRWCSPNLIPIGEMAYDIGRICISVSGRDVGHVYSWIRPEEFPVPGVNCPTTDYLRWVAPTFRDFWEVLEPISRDDWDSWW